MIRRTPDESFAHTHGYRERHGPMPRRVRKEEPIEGVYPFIVDRCAELGIEQPSFMERLRIAELEAEAWLRQHGHPAPEEIEWDELERAYDLKETYR